MCVLCGLCTVRDIDTIKGRVVHFYYIDEACREVFIVQPATSETTDVGPSNDEVAVQKHGGLYQETVFGGMRHMKPRLMERVSKGCQIDPEAARFYLVEADWDEVAAGRLAGEEPAVLLLRSDQISFRIQNGLGWGLCGFYASLMVRLNRKGMRFVPDAV